MAGEKIKDSISLQDAIRVIEAATKKAAEIGQPQDVAVCDAGGNLKAHYRMDNANIGSIHIAINKAYTAVAFQCQTRDLTDLTRPDGSLFGLSDAHGGRLCVFPGGVPLIRGGAIVGAVGVSSGTVEQDQACAEAGAAAL